MFMDLERYLWIRWHSFRNMEVPYCHIFQDFQLIKLLIAIGIKTIIVSLTANQMAYALEQINIVMAYMVVTMVLMKQ